MIQIRSPKPGCVAAIGPDSPGGGVAVEGNLNSSGFMKFDSCHAVGGGQGLVFG